jgi:hypothetical protein
LAKSIDGVFVEYTDSKMDSPMKNFYGCSMERFRTWFQDHILLIVLCGSLTQAYGNIFECGKIPESLNMECGNNSRRLVSSTNNSFSTLDHTLASGRQHVRLLLQME